MQLRLNISSVNDLKKAEQLVRKTDKSFTEIALDCGFEEISYFSRVFKQHFDVSPSQMRK